MIYSADESPQTQRQDHPNHVSGLPAVIYDNLEELPQIESQRQSEPVVVQEIQPKEVESI